MIDTTVESPMSIPEPHPPTMSSTARPRPIRIAAQMGLGLLGGLALLLPTNACERHLNGHQGAQSSTTPQAALQR
jgi:hypothetical protein